VARIAQPSRSFFASFAAFALVLASSLAAADGSDRRGDGGPGRLEPSHAANRRRNLVRRCVQRSPAESREGPRRPAREFVVQSRRVSRYGTSNVRAFSAAYTWRSEKPCGNETTPMENGRIDGRRMGRLNPLGSGRVRRCAGRPSNSTSADGGRTSTRGHSRMDEVILNVTIAARFMRMGDIVLTPMEANLNITITHARPPRRKNRDRTGDALRVMSNTRRTVGTKRTGFARNEASVNVTGETLRSICVRVLLVDHERRRR